MAETEAPDDWTFTVEESSAGVWLVSGVDSQGRSVQKRGTHPEELLRDCHRWAADLVERDRG